MLYLKNSIFPQVIYPNELKNFLSNSKEVLYNYLKGSEPIPPIKPEEPKEKEKEDYKDSIIMGIFFPFFIVLIFYFFVIKNEYIAYIVYFLSLFVFCIQIVFKIDSNIHNRKEYKRLMNLYPIKIKEYNKALNQYNIDLEIYQKKCLDVKTKLEDKEYLKNHEFKYINNHLLYSSKTFIDIENTKKGKSEDFFYNQYLYNFFQRYEIYRDKTIEIFSNGSSYFPDFLYISKNTNLVINIEIDEPYSLDETIHCLYNTHDQLRNEYFNSKGIIVLRFSEEQILNDPMGCCKVLSQLIYDLTGNDDPYGFFNALEIENVYEHRIWDHEDSLKLMKINFRNIKNGYCEDYIGNKEFYDKYMEERLIDSYFDNFD